MVTAWTEAFADFPEITIRHADILDVAHNTIVSPANSSGFMDGGVDAAYLNFFGPTIQTKVRDSILLRPEGHLPVGASLVVETGHNRIPYMIVAPTMMTPESVAADNAYRSLRAVFRIVEGEPIVGRSIFCPGLATGVGNVEPTDAAAAMVEAYRDWKNAR